MNDILPGMNMAVTGVGAGALLTIIAVGGYVGTGIQSWTALIPAFAGIPILLSSALALNPSKRALGMHIAVLFGLLGFLAPLGRLIPATIKGELTLNFATGVMFAMAVICGAFTVLCVRSFIAARKARQAEAAA
jgi:hypothetical protein